jgi:hypothetical protein
MLRLEPCFNQATKIRQQINNGAMASSTSSNVPGIDYVKNGMDLKKRRSRSDAYAS